MSEEVKPQTVDLTTVDDARLEAQITAPPQAEDTIPPDEVQDSAPVLDVEPQPAPVETPPAEPAETAEQKAARLEAQIREKELMVQRLGNELGIMRKLATRPRIDVAKVREEIREQFTTDPALAERRMEALKRYEFETDRENKLIAVPDLPQILDDMANMALAEGERPEIVQAFRNDPFRVPVNVLQEMAYKTRAYRWAKAREAEVLAKAPKPQVDPQRHGQPVIRANTPGASTARPEGPPITERDVASLTDAELESFLAQGRVR